jgi:hypothetical protein
VSLVGWEFEREGFPRDLPHWKSEMEAFKPWLSCRRPIQKASCQGCRISSRDGNLPATVAALQVEMEGFRERFPYWKSGSKPSCHLGQAANSDGSLPRSVARLDFAMEPFLRRWPDCKRQIPPWVLGSKPSLQPNTTYRLCITTYMLW